MAKETLVIPPIELEWSRWTTWAAIAAHARESGIRLPSGPGVYEVRYENQEERLYIGRASDLHSRVRQGLVKGTVPHSAGSRLRAREDLGRIVVRWASTDRSAAVEEELLRRHLRQFGRLPKYVRVG
ncbi:MAG TPA: hypothetical protein VNL95_08760 [Dehalococcoidia bacterium]|nr:hypothetical protein [Dehalococcoidia bacterium]